MNRVGWIIFSIIVVAILGGLVAWARITNPPIDISGFENNSIIAAATQNGTIGDHVAGSTAGKVILVEYGDYQCPGCGGAHPNFKSLTETYADDVTFIFRNLPLTSIHPNARAAAGVAEAAGLQGKFWEMHDILFENQNDWGNLDASKRATVFESYAKGLNLDIEKYNTDLAGTSVNQKIQFDQALFKTTGAELSTPTFFLNGEKLDDTTVGGIVQGDLTAIKAKLDALLR